VGLILDLAVVALALVVIGSLALLAWTLGVSAVRSVHEARASVAEARRAVAESEVRLVATAARIRSGLERVARLTAPMTSRPTSAAPDPTTTPAPPAPTAPTKQTPPTTPGEQPDA